MTFFPDADQPLPPDTGGRRGRKPAPIVESAGVSHRAWLEPVRSCLFASGLTLSDLVERSGYSKTRISELLRGNGYYPAWEITFSVICALGLPVMPMRRLWTAAAREADKEPDWIKQCIQQVALTPEIPPVAHQAFTETAKKAYTAYARAFLLTDHRARWVVTETFDILWLCWNEAATSENISRYAWQLLRARVMARAHRDAHGHPDLRAAVFSTAEARSTAPGQFAGLSDLVDLFAAIGRLPHDLMDVAVLRHLCGLSLTETADVLGLSAAMAHAVDHHTRATLDNHLTVHRFRE